MPFVDHEVTNSLTSPTIIMAIVLIPYPPTPLLAVYTGLSEATWMCEIDKPVILAERVCITMQFLAATSLTQNEELKYIAIISKQTYNTLPIVPAGLV